jgi:hypothetical protein
VPGGHLVLISAVSPITVPGGFMAKTRSGSLEATKPRVPLIARREEMGARSLETQIDRQLEQSEPEMGTHHRSKIGWGAGVKRKQREYQEWIRRCAVELKKTDGFSSSERFFCAAFSLLFAGKQRADLDREIDGTIDAETSEEVSLQHRLRTCGGGGRVRTKKYVADYFAANERRNREKRFHDAVLFLFHEGFTREELHRYAAQAEET